MAGTLGGPRHRLVGCRRGFTSSSALPACGRAPSWLRVWLPPSSLRVWLRRTPSSPRAWLRALRRLWRLQPSWLRVWRRRAWLRVWRRRPSWSLCAWLPPWRALWSSQPVWPRACALWFEQRLSSGPRVPLSTSSGRCRLGTVVRARWHGARARGRRARRIVPARSRELVLLRARRRRDGQGPDRSGGVRRRLT